jgi:diguanylate cyclase (GGDEF)-like protein
MPTNFTLSVATTEDSTHQLVMSATTPLHQLLGESNLDGIPHRLVQNDAGVIDGIVDLREIRRLLGADNPIERIRWEDVTVGAIADTVFAVPDDSRPNVNVEKVCHGTTICDTAGCVAIVADGQTYVNWSRISAAMQKNQFDPVTQLPTRMSCSRRLREEINRSARSGQPLAVLLVDLDHLKEINDQFGHTAGDATLLLVADSLRAGVRSYDFVARFAGDEFMVICYDCKPQDVGLPIVRLQAALAARQTANTHSASRISVSIGAAVLTRIDARLSPESIVEQADACLYQAKRAGRATAYAIELDANGVPLAPAYEIGASRSATGESR